MPKTRTFRQRLSSWWKGSAFETPVPTPEPAPTAPEEVKVAKAVSIKGRAVHGCSQCTKKKEGRNYNPVRFVTVTEAIQLGVVLKACPNCNANLAEDDYFWLAVGCWETAGENPNDTSTCSSCDG